MAKKFGKLIGAFFVSIVIGSGVGYGALYLFHILLVILLVALLKFSLDGAKFNIPKKGGGYFTFIVFMFLWYFLSIFWSIEPLYSLNYLFYLIQGVLIILICIIWLKNELVYQDIFTVLKWVFVAEIGIALLEIFTPFRLPTSPYSEYAVLFNRKSTDFQLFDSDVGFLIKTAPTAFQANPNTLAVVMVTILPFFLFLKEKKYKLLGILSIILIVIFTGSRGAFIALICSVLAYLFLVVKGRNLILIFTFLTITYAVISVNLESLKNSDNQRIAEMANSGDALNSYLFESKDDKGSISYRQILIQNGMNALWKSNGLGVGGGGSIAVQERAAGFSDLKSMHNFWIELLVDSGIFFFSLFVIWYLRLAYNIYKIYKSHTNAFFSYHAGSLFVSMLTFIIACISASSVIYLLPMWLMFGMSISLLMIYRKGKFDQQGK